MPAQKTFAISQGAHLKLTNNYNLPETIVNVLKRPTYSKGKANISATELLNSPRVVQLKRKHWDDIEEDAADMVWSLFGTAVHGVLEHGKDDHHIVEERIHTEVDGWKISGAIDLQELTDAGTILSDYKVTSAWAVMNTFQRWPSTAASVPKTWMPGSISSARIYMEKAPPMRPAMIAKTRYIVPMSLWFVENR